jgi:hypothetical protein
MTVPDNPCIKNPAVEVLKEPLLGIEKEENEALAERKIG